MLPPLPIDAILPEVVDHLQTSRAVVLTAPPGSGKTTRVPPALLEAKLNQGGRIVLLQPRRLAARAVARMMARGMDQPVGQTVGYRVRFDDCSRPATRILVVTEGILTRWLLSDPLLEGVGCVILDEFHERSVHSDLALAFLREVMEAREDLRLVVMSATLEAGPVAQFLGQCPTVSADLRTFPLTVSYLPQPAREALPRTVRSGLGRLLRQGDDGGDLLVFLPGAPEIRRTMACLEEQPLPLDADLIPLYGALSAREQDRALVPGQRRRVVLATNIAETSLTVPGVTTVLDSGLVKQLRYDPHTGLDRLELRQISKSSAKQRSGRAGRVAPGRALRLWTAAEQAALAPAEVPEIQRLDLCPVLLSVLSFHPGDPRQFKFFQGPDNAALEAALELLRLLGAVPPREHRLTGVGKRLASLPVHPRVGTLLEEARRRGLAAEGALLAALLAERDPLMRSGGRDPALPTTDSDLLYRLELMQELDAAGPQDSAARRLGLDPRSARQVLAARDQLLRRARPPRRATSLPSSGVERQRQLRQLVLAGFPDRVCRRREPGKPEAVMVGGRGVRLAPTSGVRDEELFVALEAEAGRRGLHSVSRVRVASAVDPADLKQLFPGQIRQVEEALFDPQACAVVGARRCYFGDLLLWEQKGAAVDPQRAAGLLHDAAQGRFGEVFSPDRDGQQLLARLRFAALHLPEEPWPDVSPEGLRGPLLAELCHGRRSFQDLLRLDWAAELSSRLTHTQRRLLRDEVPERVLVPSGRDARIDYVAAERSAGPPVLAVKLQEVFGWSETPCIARGRVPLLMHLLAPNGRPAQVTRDLRSFWDEGYALVRKDLRGRYPKHPWPEDPWTAKATARTTRRGKRR